MKSLLILGGFTENFRNILEKQFFAIIYIFNIFPDHFGILWVLHFDPHLISRKSRFVNTDFDLILFELLFFRFPSNECFLDNV